MKVETVVVGNLEENCYVISKNDHVLIIDPGDEFIKIKQLAGERVVDGVLITHCHFDHVGALSQVLDFYQTKKYDYFNLEESEIKIGEFIIQVIYNPGHTEDSISFYMKEEKMMFVGDFVFQNSIGRCDLDGGDFSKMQQSLEKIKKYPKDTILYPGHGNQTTLQEELKNNPFF